MASSRWLPLAALIGAVAASLYLWQGWCLFPLYEWNDMRLAPAFALRHGLTLYPPAGGGPLSTWIYGPVGAAINLPATLAGSAVGAIECAGAINLLTLALPLVVIVFGARELRWPQRVLALAAAILLLPPTSLTFQVADHPAFALGLLSCWWLASNQAPGAGRLAACALGCVLAAWAKQTTVFLAVAQLLFLWSEGERRAAKQYLGWLAVFGAASAALALSVSDFGNLWLNLVQIPARLPWGDLREKLALRSVTLLVYIVVPLVALAVLRARKRWPGDDTESGRFFRCCALVFLVLLPPGLAAYFKLGGDINALHSPFYLWPAALLLAATRTRACFFAGVAVVVLLRLPQLTAVPGGPLTARVEQAVELSRARPARTWFPFNPVVTFYTDGKLYHVEDGVATRYLAGMGLREADFRRHLPSPLEAVIYPAENQQPFALQLLGEFNQQTPAGFWRIYERRAAR